MRTAIHGHIPSGVMRQSQTVHGAWHVNVREKGVQDYSVDLEHVKRFFGVLSFHDLKPFVAESVCHRNANQLLILGDDDADAFWHDVLPERFPSSQPEPPVCNVVPHP